MQLLRPARERWLTPISYTPLLMIYGLLAFSYYVFVVQVQLDYYVKQNVTGSVILLVVYHVLLLLVLYTYTRLILQTPGFASDLPDCQQHRQRHHEMISVPAAEGEPLVVNEAAIGLNASELSGELNTPITPQMDFTTTTTTNNNNNNNNNNNIDTITTMDTVSHETGIGLNKKSIINDAVPSRTGSEQTLITANPINVSQQQQQTPMTETASSSLPSSSNNDIIIKMDANHEQSSSNEQSNELPRTDSNASEAFSLGQTTTPTVRRKRERYCHICRRPKPDRAHHCSQCNECVLRMDHHCPWVVGCVGYRNHKLFFLFLFYVSIFTFYVAITIGVMLGLYMDDSKKPNRVNGVWVALTALAGLWSLMLIPFAGMHGFQILTNQTTLEYMKRQSAQHRMKAREKATRRRLNSNPEAVIEDQTEAVLRDEEDLRNPWHQGLLNNWKSVMGENMWLWFVPIPNR
ncbi:DHHC palmitoyltransferase-domain-containing protein [Syncephalis fuscata]|nr:DHHC palmitoyltransferase-domain-containing protein [Syncephalis fuscata]